MTSKKAMSSSICHIKMNLLGSRSSILKARRYPSTSWQARSLAKTLLAPSCCLLVGLSLVLTFNSASSFVGANPRPISTESTKLSSAPDDHQALNYLLFSSSTSRQDAELPKIEELLKDENHNHVSDAVNLPLANSVWKRMHQNALEFAQQRAHEAKPAVNRLLLSANVSASCFQSLNDVMEHLSQLDFWAVQMYNSFGDFPAAGFFEGSFTSLGSYHQCVDLDPNQWIGSSQYCTFKFQPVVPKRPRYHSILAPVENLANFTSKTDMFNQWARKAQYFYYTKLKIATCMPSRCDKSDLEALGKQVAINTYLQYSGVSCLKREEGFNPDGAQVFAIAILLGLASVSLLGTLVHLFNLRSLFEQVASTHRRHSSTSNSTTNSADLNRVCGLNGSARTKGHFNSNQAVVVQQQAAALLGGSQQKTPILPPPVIQVSSSSVNSSKSTFSTQMVTTIDVLMHFSIVKNARKLFDTSTSRHHSGKNRTGSILPGLTKGPSSANSTSDESDSTTSSVADTGHCPSQANVISCVHGLRFWTISWIIFGHTMQYTEWSGFARAYQVEKNLVSFFVQPLLNATFSVDTFFLVSGLLTTYVTWTITRGQYKRFNKFAFLISRYLRLTPQVLIVILLFIVFPMMGDGPHWRGLIQKESDNCKRNWWVSALYLQAFIKQDQICNLVTWWLSIEMFYHFVSIVVIIALLHSNRNGILTTIAIGGGMTAYSCYLHYVNHYPPNMLPTLPQRYEVWDSIVLKYFWTPYPHAPAYFVGLLLGYVLYSRSICRLSKLQVRLGWTAFVMCYLMILFGTYSWNNNAPYSRLSSTIYYNVSQVLWSLATGWAILACALGYGGWLNSFLSSPIFVPLGRATYMTYLSHMLVVMSYPAKMNLLIEPSYMVFSYIFITNLFLSYALGIILTLVYESPILHLQKLLVSNMANKFNDDNNNTSSRSKISETEKVVRVSLYTQQQVVPSSDVENS